MRPYRSFKALGKSRGAALGAALVFLLLGQAASAFAQETKLTCEQIEEFLRTANIGTQRDLPQGVTVPKRATLDDGKMKHDASIQTIHESKKSFTTARGTELNFKDWWEFNVAGYELAKMIGLNMVPVYVARKVGGKEASLSWWIDGSIMELDRIKKNMQPPDTDSWNKQMYALRVFNQLIGNTDANLTNTLITSDWQVWMIDFTRAFRATKDLLNPKDLVMCDRKMLAGMKAITKDEVKEKLGKYIGGFEIDGLMARRDKIVKFFDEQAAQKGEATVLYDFPRTSQPCGTGL